MVLKSSRSTCGSLMGRTPSHVYSIWSGSLIYTNFVTIASLYLEPQQFVWYQWKCECKRNTIISWSIFTEELITYHDDVKINSFFTHLINLRRKGQVIEHIQ